MAATTDESFIALQAKSEDFRRWIEAGHGAAISIINHRCPKCNGQLVCGYADMGATDIYDTFAHVCLTWNCDYGETKTLYSSSDDSPQPDCPLCAALEEKK